MFATAGKRVRTITELTRSGAVIGNRVKDLSINSEKTNLALLLEPISRSVGKRVVISDNITPRLKLQSER